MKAAADASILIFFAKLEKLGLLLRLYPGLCISKTVFDEIMAGNDRWQNECEEIRKLINGKKIIVAAAKGKENLSGEKSTIMLAKSKKIGIVLMDDYAGSREAKLHGLKVYSCPYLILRALKHKYIAKKEFDRLLEGLLEYNYFISPKLLKKIIEISDKI